MNALAEAAIAYAQAGIAVFPLRPQTKIPYGYTKGFLSATTDIETIKGWWSGRLPLPLRDPEPDETLPDAVYAKPTSNIGIATGAVSGFWVDDLDGEDGAASHAALIAEHGELPDTVEQRTGGGRHLCFAWDPATPVKTRAGKLAKGIDTRGDGGYIVAPPSIHPGDKAKGVPPGRVYAWLPGRAPGEIPFAPAPAWLLALAEPPAEPKPEPAPYRPNARGARMGGTSAYGAATLATSCRTVAQAAPGTRRITVFNYAAFVGGLVAGGEIARDEAKRELIAAGMAQAVDKPWKLADLEKFVENGLRKGELHPQSAPPLDPDRPATHRPARVRQESAPLDRRDVAKLWSTARDADCGAARDRLRLRGLPSDTLKPVLKAMRVRSDAPISREASGPALLIPLSGGCDPAASPDALAILPLMGDFDRPTHFVGDRSGCVALLTAWPADGALVIAQTLADLCELWVGAQDIDHHLGAVFAPTLSAFAGRALGDKWGRSDPLTPTADPDAPPWTAPGPRSVYLAVRGDLRTPEIATRKTFGGTRRACFEGEAAARYFAGLAEQAWRRAGATHVQIMRPSQGVGFSERWRG